MRMQQSLKNRTKILNDIHQERSRQDHLHQEEKTMSERYVTLGEEIGKVSTAIQNNDKENLYEELIQVAAVAVRMAEQVIEGDVNGKRMYNTKRNKQQR